MRGIIMDIDITEYSNNPPLPLMQTCESRLKQIESLDRSVMTDCELKSVKNEIRDLCFMLHGIEVINNEWESNDV